MDSIHCMPDIKKILFLHGFTSGGQCEIAHTLREELAGTADIISPDLPLSPISALSIIRLICKRKCPDLIVGSSCGAFYAQQIVRFEGIPALLINPYFKMSEFLSPRIGISQYKCPRQNGETEYEVTEQLIEEFRQIEDLQFHFYDEFDKERVWGLFGTEDSIADFNDVFSQYFSISHTFQGKHTMSSDNVKEILAPTIKEMLQKTRPTIDRYFKYYKGDYYKICHTAFNNETGTRSVIYQSLQSDKKYHCCFEEEFFERIPYKGKSIPRFKEITSKNIPFLK